MVHYGDLTSRRGPLAFVELHRQGQQWSRWDREARSNRILSKQIGNQHGVAGHQEKSWKGGLVRTGPKEFQVRHVWMGSIWAEKIPRFDGLNRYREDLKGKKGLMED